MISLRENYTLFQLSHTVMKTGNLLSKIMVTTTELCFILGPTFTAPEENALPEVLKTFGVKTTFTSQNHKASNSKLSSPAEFFTSLHGEQNSYTFNLPSLFHFYHLH